MTRPYTTATAARIDREFRSVEANSTIGHALAWQVEAAAEIEAILSRHGIGYHAFHRLPKNFRNHPDYLAWLEKWRGYVGSTE
jgi:hypothetical protein